MTCNQAKYAQDIDLVPLEREFVPDGRVPMVETFSVCDIDEYAIV